MSLNQYMHPRNPFQSRPNFRELALQYPDFRKHVTYNLCGKVQLDFRDRNAQQALFRTLLKHYYKMDVNILDGHLVPAIPQRLNYLLWVEDLLQLLPTTERTIRGIDIGTGSSCILCLLGHKQCGWDFVAVEVDDAAATCARENVHRNELDAHIKVVKASTIGEVMEPEMQMAFVTCNPPFYSSQDEAEATPKAIQEGRQPPSSDMGGTTQEKVWGPGGEVAFVKDLIQESLQLTTAVSIYTVMIGKKKSSKEILKELRRHNIKCTTTELCQGKTMRWGVAWTFLDIDFANVTYPKRPKPKPPLEWVLPHGAKVPDVFAAICKALREIEVPFDVVKENKNMSHLWVRAQKDSWSHQRRKRREMLRSETSSPPKKMHRGEPTEPDAVPADAAPREEGLTSVGEVATSTALSVPDSPCEEIELVLSCDIKVQRTDTAATVHLQTRHGEREMLHRLLQFLKNKVS
ncbi:U6 small nuclear RNA (adenine-(43)-N(6))-methyltransferase-like [Ornithodoros turicata]|uniref:U6 small nuclear RNA (adenine-(43)-N(6))-methyltransferase-like n=1 Tax=Ornithodoros turicata TaxID=34597 RepID=UPI00313A0ECB